MLPVLLALDPREEKDAAGLSFRYRPLLDVTDEAAMDEKRWIGMDGWRTKATAVSESWVREYGPLPALMFAILANCQAKNSRLS